VKPRVHTYFQPVPQLPSADKLIALWKWHWTEHGFEPVVLSEQDAKDHPGYDHFVERIRRFPTSNPKAYEMACFLRHLAMANVGGGTVLDLDVFPNPRRSSRSYLHNMRVYSGPKFIFMEPTRVPCAIMATAEGYEDFCDILCEYQGTEPHISDMIIARKTKLPVANICVEHLDSGRPIENDPGDGWKDAPLVHFSNYSFQKLGWKGDKADCIERVLKSL
jgi:hypothetical protein